MTKREAYQAFNGKLIGRYFMKRMVCDVVVALPEEMARFITKNCWFVSSMEDAWGFAFTGNDIKDQHLIFLSEDLFLQTKQQIYFSIAHEIGHVILKHRNSVLIQQTKKEIKKQEKDADQFANEVAQSFSNVE